MKRETLGWVILGDTDSVRRVMLLCLVFILLGPILVISLVVPFKSVRDWIDRFTGRDWQ